MIISVKSQTNIRPISGQSQAYLCHISVISSGFQAAVGPISGSPRALSHLFQGHLRLMADLGLISGLYWSIIRQNLGKSQEETGENLRDVLGTGRISGKLQANLRQMSFII